MFFYYLFFGELQCLGARDGSEDGGEDGGEDVGEDVGEVHLEDAGHYAPDVGEHGEHEGDPDDPEQEAEHPPAQGLRGHVPIPWVLG